MLSNCGGGEDSQDPLGIQGDETSQSLRKSTLNIYWADTKTEAPMLWLPEVKS